MKNKHFLFGLIFSGLLMSGTTIKAQQSLWFGTVKAQNKIMQGRFEISGDSIIRNIIYAPYGITPTTFTNVKQYENKLVFGWQIHQLSYHCILAKKDSTTYNGECTCESGQPIQVVMRQFTNEDAILQGDSLHASAKDLAVIDRALILLNNGTNWNRFDNRVCDIDSYPYNWSLFCALHQASIDVDSEYKHLRPANQAVRQAINEVSNGKQYAHLLQDYNNEAQSFDVIAKVLNRAKEIIIEKIKQHQ
ncbi:MAG: hypothetical protein ABUT20_02415 [Bacteroidota bacterium]